MRETNLQAPLFGDATGGAVYNVREQLNHRLRRLYSEDTLVWSSYEAGKPAYVRIEMAYQRKLYTGLGLTEELAWRALSKELPTIERDLDFRLVGHQGWFIIYLYTQWGDWCCEGTHPLEIMVKLLKRAERVKQSMEQRR